MREEISGGDVVIVVVVVAGRDIVKEAEVVFVKGRQVPLPKFGQLTTTLRRATMHGHTMRHSRRSVVPAPLLPGISQDVHFREKPRSVGRAAVFSYGLFAFHLSMQVPSISSRDFKTGVKAQIYRHTHHMCASQLTRVHPGTCGTS